MFKLLWRFTPTTATKSPLNTVISGTIAQREFLSRICSSDKKRVFKGQERANKACTRRVGFCGIFKHFSGFEFFSTSRSESTPAHTRVTQTVGQKLSLNLLRWFQKYLASKIGVWVFKIRFRVFSKVSGSQKSAFLAVAIFQILVSRKSAYIFGSKSFVSNWLRSPKSASRFLVKVLVSKSFYLAKFFLWLAFCLAKSGF